jgi:hypothetical protein
MKTRCVAEKLPVLLSVCAVAVISVSAFPPVRAQDAEQLQNIMQQESRALSSRDWTSVGDSWLAQAGMVATVINPKIWEKSSYDTSKFPAAVAMHKRAVACFIKAYDAEGEHATPMSRQRSDALRCLLKAYKSAQTFDPQNADWHYLRGEALCAQGWYVEGNRELSKAISLGGSGGAKASSLAAHVKPFYNSELALETRLNKKNEQINTYNGNHPVNTQQVYTNAERARMSSNALYFMRRDQH